MTGIIITVIMMMHLQYNDTESARVESLRVATGIPSAIESATVESVRVATLCD